MFECCILLRLPLCSKGEQECIKSQVAKYDFDLGLQEGERVRVNNASFTRTRVDGKRVESDGPKFSFEAMVVSRKKFINIEASTDAFLIAIELEMVDKEQIPKIVSHLKKTFPDSYEDYQPPTEADSDQRNN